MKRFNNILFVADFKLQCSEAFEKALMLAENNQANLTVVSISDEAPSAYLQKIKELSQSDLNDPANDRLQLDNLMASNQKNIKVNIKLLTGRHFLAIIHEVLNYKIDLVIKTVDETLFIDRFLGSSDMHLLRKCPCPVWLIKSQQQGGYHKIMVAVDFDPFNPNLVDDNLNQQLMEMSISLALSEFSELHIIHAWDAYGEDSLRSGMAKQADAVVDAYVNEIHLKHQNQLNELVYRFFNKTDKDMMNYLKPKVHLIKGFAGKIIPALVKKLQIDLIMMGTVGRTGITGFFMGNTSETILNQIDCSLLAIKPKGFVSPISLEE